MLAFGIRIERQRLPLSVSSVISSNNATVDSALILNQNKQPIFQFGLENRNMRV